MDSRYRALYLQYIGFPTKKKHSTWVTKRDLAGERETGPEKTIHIGNSFVSLVLHRNQPVVTLYI